MTARLSGGYRPEHFAVDGPMRDVCVPDAGLPVWERLLRAVADSSWEHQLGVDNEPCPIADFSVADFFATPDDLGVSARLAIRVGEQWFVTFFFEVEEIEFVFDPADITGEERFGDLERFMIWLADACDRKVVMTMETSSGHQGMPALLETV